MTSTSQVTASLSARAPEAAMGGPRSARGSAKRASGSTAWPGGLAPAAPGPSGEAFTTVLARHLRRAAESPVSRAADEVSDDAALDEEPEAARPDDEVLGAFAAPSGPALPATSAQGIGVLLMGQGEAVLALGVPGAASPAPGSLEPGSPDATVGIEEFAAARGPGSPLGIASRRAASVETGAAPGASPGPGGIEEFAAARGAGSPLGIAPRRAASAVTGAAPGALPAPGGIEDSAAAQGPGSPPQIAPRRAVSAVARVAAGAPPAPGSSATASSAATGVPASGPAALSRAEAARTAAASDGPPASPSPPRENVPDAFAEPRAVSATFPIAVLAAGEVAHLSVSAEHIEPELGAAVSAAAPGRPRIALRSARDASEGGRPSTDEGADGELSSGAEVGTARASAGDTLLRVPAAAVDRPPRRERDGLGAGAPETGDDAGAVAVVVPGQPAVAAEAEASRAELAVSARSAAEQIAEEITERLGLIRRPGLHEISLELRPDNLGTVHLAARLEGRQLTLEIRAELAQSRDLLQQALPQLRELLVQQGIDAGRVTIHLGLDTGARDFSGQHFGAPRHFMRDEALPGSSALDGAPVRRRQPGPGRFDFWV